MSNANTAPLTAGFSRRSAVTASPLVATVSVTGGKDCHEAVGVTQLCALPTAVVVPALSSFSTRHTDWPASALSTSAVSW